MPTSPAKFTGFSAETLRFLVELEKNNRREWFNERKAFYKETVEEELRLLVVSTSAALARKKIPLSTEPKKAIFRIYRDTRFSADKTPYKTNLGAVFNTGGKPGSGVLYVHVEPKASFTAIGFESLRARDSRAFERPTGVAATQRTLGAGASSLFGLSRRVDSNLRQGVGEVRRR